MPGAKLVAKGTVKLVMKDAGITNNGTIIPASGTVIFTGTSAGSASFIGGESTSSFYNLTMNKTSNGMQLNGNIEVSNTLDLQSGDSLFLNNHTIQLGNTGSLNGETETRRITGYNGGYIEAIGYFSSLIVAKDQGNLGIAITSVLTKNLGTTTIRRGHQIQAGGSVSRYYDIIPTNNNNLNATITFSYFESELNDNKEYLLDYYSSADEGSNWTNEGGTPDYIGNSVTHTFDTLNRLTLGNLPNMILPLSLPLHSLTLSGNANAQQNSLQWIATGISGNGVCVVEKSTDATIFSSIATIPYNAVNGSQQRFVWIDNNPQNGQCFYRIKAVNNEGKIIFSNGLMLQRTSSVMAQLYPNPARGSVQISANNIRANTIDIGIYTLNGQLIQQQTVPVLAQQIRHRINISHLPAGIYVVRSVALPQIQQLLTVY